MLIGFPPFLLSGRQVINETNRLTPRERRFFFAYLETLCLAEAFKQAFPNRTLKRKTLWEVGSRTMRKIKEKYDWEKLLEEAGLGQERAIGKLNQLLDAKITKFYQDKSLGEFTDNTTRMRALELLVDLHGLRKQVVEHQGTITFTEAIIQNYENRKLRLVGNDEHSTSSAD